MSTILDSLKKSSDQRESNEKNSLNNFKFGSPKNSSSMRYVLLLVFIIVFSFGFYYFMKNYYYAEDQIHVEAIEKPQKQPANTEKNVNNKKQQPNINEVKNKVKELEAEKIRNEVRLANEKLDSPQINDQQESDQPKDSSFNKIDQKLREISSQKVEGISPENEQQPQISDLEQRINDQQQGVVRQLDPSDYQVPEQDYQFVHQLPFSIRKDLPKFKLNVHIFDKNPESRVAIINGVRFNIGDSIEEIVIVKDIVQEGVLLDFNGEEFLVPR